jgi:hypothetical protein
MTQSELVGIGPGKSLSVSSMQPLKDFINDCE